MARTVLVIDDEQNMRWVLGQALEKAGYDVLSAENGAKGLQQFARNSVDLVLLDLKMPGMDGLAVLRELRQRSANVPILLLTAYATVPTAVEALHLGATDYLRKPFDLETILAQINKFLSLQKGEPEEEYQDLPRAAFSEFVGASPSLRRPLALAEAATLSPYPVVLYGADGTGRRHLAQVIHHHSTDRAPGRLALVDCSSLPSSVLTKELLDSSDDGGVRLWQQALGGTLLLANADALEKSLLPKLVAHLRDYLYSPQRPHGLRLMITSENRLFNEWASIADEAITIEMPTLHDHQDDLPLLRKFFAPDAQWSHEASAYLSAYSWPGNVGELRRVVEQASLAAGDSVIQAEHLPSHLTATSVEAPGIFNLPPDGIDLEQVEEDLIRQALAMSQGNKSRAARLLGLSRATLLYRLDKYEIDASD